MPQVLFFLPYQQRWIQDSSQIKIMEKSRQIGISWTSAYALVRRHTHGTSPLDSWVSSHSEVQARLFLQDCKAFARTLNIATTALNAPLIPETKKTAAASLCFNNGTSIHSLSSNPDAQAGKRGSRILDEFALHPDPKHLYAIAYPGITWGGQLEIISTHRGSHNFFNSLIQDILHNGNPKNISHHKVTLQDALDQGFLKKLKSKLPKDDSRQGMDDAAYFDFIRNSCSDQESFLQEYMCQPEDDTAAFITPNCIHACEYPRDTPWEFSFRKIKNSHHAFYLGIDLGRHHDLTVFWLLESINDILFSRQVLALKDTPFSIQEKTLYDFLSIPSLRRVCIDQSGLGRQFAEQAIERFGPGRVEGISFTAPTKEALAYPLRAAIENRQIRIPSDPQIRADLRAIKKDITAAGNIRFSADRSKNGHADHFWALALALHAAKTAPRPLYYESLSKKSN